MSDAADFRATLNLTDMSAPAIQASSRAMMRFYDKPGGANVAVSEWRSVLQTANTSQYLPLLYVANEVLQTSKRNRGNKFLEAFSPVLGSSLQYICGRDKSAVEKVRRTVKIWGDRHVFSMRYVMDVLEGLEQFRDGGNNSAGGKEMAAASSSTATSSAVSVSKASSTATKAASPLPMKPLKSPSVSVTTDSDDDEYYDDDNIFGVGEGDGPKLLDISIDATALSSASSVQQTSNSREFGAGAKRRRSKAEAASKSSSSSAPHSPSNTTGGVPSVKKPKALSSQNFFDLFQSVVNLDERFKASINYIQSIPPSYLDDESTGGGGIDDLVGDELTDMYKKVCQTQRNIRKERRTMYSVAVQRRELEKEAKRYISWLKNLAKVDDEDIDFVNKLEKKLDVLSVCYGKLMIRLVLFPTSCTIQRALILHISFSFTDEAKSSRDKRRADEARQRAEAHEAERRRAEEEERRRILDDAKMEAEAKPGMVWNKEKREYEYLHATTEESWRD